MQLFPPVWQYLRVLSLALVVMVTGCESAGPAGTRVGAGPAMTPANSSARRFAADPASLRPIAERTFRQYYRIDPAASDPADNFWASRPLEVDRPAGAERVRDVLGQRERYRQLAELRLVPQGGAVVASVRVRTQRLETAERASFGPGFRADDRPFETPSERTGTASPLAREEWVEIQRDRTRETQILDEIQARLHDLTAGPATQPAASAATRPADRPSVP